MNCIEAIGFLGGVLGVLPALPQVRRVRALGHGQGVSLSTWLLLFVVSMTWTGFGLRIESPSVIVTNFLAGLLNAAVVLALAARYLRSLLALVALAAAIIGISLVLPIEVVSGLLVVLTLARLPQVKQSWDNRNRVHESAVSLPSVAVTVASLVCWQVWAVLVSRPIVNLTTSIALVLTLAIAGLEVLGRTRSTGAISTDLEVGADPSAVPRMGSERTRLPVDGHGSRG